MLNRGTKQIENDQDHHVYSSSKQHTCSYNTVTNVVLPINSLVSGRFAWEVIFSLILMDNGWGISFEIALRKLSLDF